MLDRGIRRQAVTDLREIINVVAPSCDYGGELDSMFSQLIELAFLPSNLRECAMSMKQLRKGNSEPKREDATSTGESLEIISEKIDQEIKKFIAARTKRPAETSHESE